VIEGHRSRREREASAQSAHVAERASAIDRVHASTRSMRTHRLSEGVVVEASIVARLLRWRLLTLDASVVLLPANAPRAGGAVGAPPGDARSRGRSAPGRLSEAIRDIERAEHELTKARRANHAAASGRRRPA
jgi:hypothetical protein